MYYLLVLLILLMGCSQVKNTIDRQTANQPNDLCQPINNKLYDDTRINQSAQPLLLFAEGGLIHIVRCDELGNSSFLTECKQVHGSNQKIDITTFKNHLNWSLKYISQNSLPLDALYLKRSIEQVKSIINYFDVSSNKLDLSFRDWSNQLNEIEKRRSALPEQSIDQNHYNKFIDKIINQLASSIIKSTESFVIGPNHGIMYELLNTYLNISSDVIFKVTRDKDYILYSPNKSELEGLNFKIKNQLMLDFDKKLFINLKSSQITQSQWYEVMGYNPSSVSLCADEPVENVSLPEVLSFINKINQNDKKYNYRLPKLEEWNYVFVKSRNLPVKTELDVVSEKGLPPNNILSDFVTSVNNSSEYYYYKCMITDGAAKKNCEIIHKISNYINYNLPTYSFYSSASSLNGFRLVREIKH